MLSRIVKTLANRAAAACGLLCALFCTTFSARAQAPTEQALLQKILHALQTSDSNAYADVFPSADTIVRVTLRKAPDYTDAYKTAQFFASSPELSAAQDTLIRKDAFRLFNDIMRLAERYSIHWTDVLMNRYELEALGKTRDEALEAIAPERYVGYLFLEDMQTRRTYAVDLSDIRKMDGKWYGGEMSFLAEATSKDELNAAIKAEKKRLLKGLPDTLLPAADTAAHEDDDEDAPSLKRKQVADRKYYTGYLDDETFVSLYVRYIKGDCPGGVCSYEALFRFGDNDYMRMEVSKHEGNKWTLVEQETGGVMDLELKDGIFSGVFSATTDKVDYDAELKEKTMTKKKMENLDALLDRDLTH